MGLDVDALLAEAGISADLSEAEDQWLDNDRLTRLVKALWAALEPLGFWPDFRHFRPHVTIARRCARGRSGDVEPLLWPVSGFELMVSVQDHKGAAYRVHRSWPLNPA